MAISPEQVQEIKKQLIQQIQKTFPEDKKQEAIQKIDLMNNDELMVFLEQNGMVKNSDSQNEQNPEQQCIFCSIISGQIPSTKISENENAIAILELNPLSEGHTLIVPKNHNSKITEEIKSFAQKIKQKLNSSLKPKQILEENSNMFGHEVLNLIPVYSDEIPKERKKSSPEELSRILEKINSENYEKETTKKEIQKPEILTEEDTIIPKRIP